jgi:hypothetical protein
MRIKNIRTGIFFTGVMFAFACSSTQQQEGEDLALEQEGQMEMTQEDASSQQGNEEATENQASYENTAETGNEYSEQMNETANMANESAEETDEDNGNSLAANDLSEDMSANELAANDVLNAEVVEEQYSDDAAVPAEQMDTPASYTNGKRVMYVAQDMVAIYSSPDPTSEQIGSFDAGDPVLAEVSGSFAKVGEGKFIMIDSLSEQTVGRTKTANPWR